MSGARAGAGARARAGAGAEAEAGQESAEAPMHDSSSTNKGTAKVAMNRAVKRLLLINRVIHAFKIEDTCEAREPDCADSERPQSRKALSWRGRNPLMPCEFDPAPRNAKGASDVSHAFEEMVGSRCVSSPLSDSATATAVVQTRRNSTKKWHAAFTKINAMRQFQSRAKPGLHSKLAKVLIEAKVDDKGAPSVRRATSAQGKIGQSTDDSTLASDSSAESRVCHTGPVRINDSPKPIARRGSRAKRRISMMTSWEKEEVVAEFNQTEVLEEQQQFLSLLESATAPLQRN